MNAEPIDLSAQPAPQGVAYADLHQRVEELIEKESELRRVVEIIALGESANPVIDAGNELVALGYWDAGVVAALRASHGQAPASRITVEQVEDAVGLQSTAWDTIGAEKIVEAVLRSANGQAPAAQVDSQPALDRTRIREIFMTHGFTVKEGQTDLKQYVYDAADALLRAARAPAESQPVLDSLALMKVVMRADEALAGRCTRGTTNWAAAIGKAVQDAVLADRAPADSVTAPAGGGMAGPSDDEILNRTGTGYAPGTREYDLDLIRWYRERIAAPAAQADSVLEDAAPRAWTNVELTEIYNQANDITTKNPPLTTERIFAAMRRMAEITQGGSHV